ncbi:MAG: hypothetical protein ACOCWQ_03265 [Nanoarchaeota archaeon]
MAQYKGKGAVVGRMPRVNNNEYKTLFIKIFQESEPLTTDGFPKEELVFENIEKAVFKNCTPQYYLEGNDLVFDDISQIDVEIEGHVAIITCK